MTKWLYLLISFLIAIIAIQGGLVYATATNSSVTLGVANPFHVVTLDEQIAGEKAVNDPELQSILDDSKNRGHLE